MCTPITASALHTATSNWATKLGEGATGEVFAGVLDGAPVAVKRLRAPKGASADVLASLRRRFRAELTTLSAFRHPRIVRLLHACEDTGDAAHPFALVFELLEEGSLADHLRSGQGAAARRAPLTPHQRCDAALGIAHGLAFLHGLREEGGEGGAQGAPCVHRDIKSANVGFTVAAGQSTGLYAKVIDCGLAKALRGEPVAAAAAASGGGGGGASFSEGVLGTPGYMAPELIDVPPRYTIASEVYSFGVVLLELLMGASVGVGTASAPDLVRQASLPRSAPRGRAAVAERADPAWPEAARDALADLILHCVGQYEDERPQSMQAVIGQLKAVRALLGAGGSGSATAPPPAMRDCCVCWEEVEAGSGVTCKSAGAGGGGGGGEPHFVCHGCLQDHVKASVSTGALTVNAGGIPCVGAKEGCAAPPWTLEDLADRLDKGAFTAYAAGMRYLAVDLPRLLAARAAERARLDAEIARIADIRERARRIRLRVVEEDFTLHCPRCGGAFFDFKGCAALQCKDDAGPPARKGCGTSFCAVCLADCGGDAHAHVRSTHAPAPARASGNPAEMYYFSPAVYAAAHRAMRGEALAARLRALVAGGEAEVAEAVLQELDKVDLVGVGLLAPAVREAAGMPPLGWTCAACTLINGEGSAACEACEAPRVGGGAAAAAAAVAAAAAPLPAGYHRGGVGHAAPGPRFEPPRHAAAPQAAAAAASPPGAAMGAGAGAGGGTRSSPYPTRNDPPSRVVELMQGVHANARTAEEGVRALVSLAWPHHGKVACLGCGAVRAVLLAMTVHVSNAVILEHGSWALCNMAFDFPAVQLALVEQGGGEVLARSLRWLLSSGGDGGGEAVKWTCGVIIWLTKHGAGQGACRAAGLVPMLVAAQQRISRGGGGGLEASSGAIDEDCAWELCNLANTAGGQGECLAAGAVEALQGALVEHAALPGVCEWCAGALTWISNSPEGQAAAVGAVPALTGALRSCRAQALVCRHAAWALSNVSNSAEGRAAVLGAGALGPVVEAMLAHPLDAGIAEWACGVLVWNAKTLEGQAACAAAGAVGAVCGALRLHAGEEKVCENAAWSLRDLAWSDAGRRAEIVAAGGVALLRAAQARFPGRTKAREALERILGEGSGGSGGSGEGMDAGMVGGAGYQKGWTLDEILKGGILSQNKE